MAVARTIGADASRQHATMAEFEAWLSGTDHGSGVGVLVDDLEGVISNDTAAGLPALSPASVTNFKSGTWGSFTVTLKAAAGQSFYESNDPLTDRLWLDPDKGVLIEGVNGVVLDVTRRGFKLLGLQIAHAGWFGGHVVDFYVTGDVSGIIADKCLFYTPQMQATPFATVYGRGFTLNDCLVVTSEGSSSGASAAYGPSQLNNCTVANVSGETVTGNVGSGNNTCTLYNTAVFGFANFSGTTFAGDYIFTDKPSGVPGTHSVKNLVFADAFENVQTSGSRTGHTTTDLRAVAAGPLDGVAGTAYATADDIYFQTRSLTAPFAGAHEIIASGATSYPGTFAATGTGTMAATGIMAGAGVFSATGSGSVVFAGSATFVADPVGAQTAPEVSAATVAQNSTAAPGSAEHILEAGAASISLSNPGAFAATGTGTMAATGTAPSGTAGAFAATGTGTMAGVGTVSRKGAFAATGTGTMAATGTATSGTAGTFAATGTGTMAGAGTVSRKGTFAATGTGTMAALGTVAGSTSGIFGAAGAGSMAVLGTVSRKGVFATIGAGSLAGLGVRVVHGSIAISGAGSLAASGNARRRGVAAFSGGGNVAALGSTHRRGAFSVIGTGTMAAAGVSTGDGSFVTDNPIFARFGSEDGAGGSFVSEDNINGTLANG